MRQTKTSKRQRKTRREARKSPVRQQTRAGLIFPVGRIGRLMRAKQSNLRVGGTGPVFMAAVLEYLCADILHYAAEETEFRKKKRITPKMLIEVIKND